VLILDLLPYCKGNCDKNYKHRLKKLDPVPHVRGTHKRHRTTSAASAQIKTDAMNARFDPIEDDGLTEEEDKDDKTDKPEKDCEHGDFDLPQSIVLSRLFARLYSALLYWFGCLITHLGM
jgi:hypothetical protein